MKLNLLLFIFIYNGFVLPQTIKNWSNFTNKQSTIKITVDKSNVWAATEGGVFQYFSADSSFLELTKSEGLSSQSNTSIAVDKNNKIWIGTSEGYINVYDPNNGSIAEILEIFKTNKSIKKINDIYIKGDTAFVSTEFGLSLININNLSFFDSILKFGDFTSETPVKGVYLGSKIYVNTQAGIVYNKSGSSNLTAPESWLSLPNIPSVSVNKIVEFNGTIYAATNKGLYKYTSGVWQLLLYSNSVVNDLFIFDGKIYSLLENSLRVYNNSADELIFNFAPIKLIGLSINDLGVIFIASNIGLIKYKENNYELIYPNGPKTNSLINIAVDQEGNLWSATGDDLRGVGILKLSGDEWSYLDKSNTKIFKSDAFHKVTASEDAVYFSNWGKGFIRLKNNDFEIFDAENTSLVGIPGATKFLVINDVREDQNKNTWVLNYWSAEKKPLSVLTPEGNWFHFEFGKTLVPQIVRVDNLIIDQFNTKWFAVVGEGEEGLYFFNDNGTFDNLEDDKWGKITKSNGLRDKDVNALAIDQFGELIIGTSVGVDVISDPSNPSSLRGNQYFPVREQTINGIAVDPINQKWFATEKGIFITSSDGSSLIANFNSINSPLPSDKIRSIALDNKSGNVFVSTDFGLTRIATLFVQPNENFSDLRVYPNPLVLNNNSDINIFFDGLVKNSEIKILNIDGDLVNQFNSIGGRTSFWNGRDLEGKLVPSGIYIIVAYDNEVNQIATTKLAVIRK